MSKKFLLCLFLLASSTGFAATTDITETTDMSPWLIRLRLIDVVPYPSSGTLALIGGKVDSVSTQTVPEFDINYFFTPHIASELILATSRHSVTATGTSLGRVGLGGVRILPPTLTIQYHFLPNCIIRPYIGVGVNYTTFNNVSSGPVASSVSYQNTFGPAVQMGSDFALTKHWLLNVDAKKIYVQPNVDVRTALGTIHTKVHLNPVVIGAGVGYQF